jgi:hypothetical protein
MTGTLLKSRSCCIVHIVHIARVFTDIQSKLCKCRIVLLLSEYDILWLVKKKWNKINGELQ